MDKQASNGEDYPCNKLKKAHLCTDYIKYKDDGFASDNFKYNAFCAYDFQSCYMTKSVDEENNVAS